jgi:hypothetical protein
MNVIGREALWGGGEKIDLGCRLLVRLLNVPLKAGGGIGGSLFGTAAQ